MEKEYILCAATYFNDGKKYEEQPSNIEQGFVSCGYRHGHSIIIGYALAGDCATKDGFLTSKNRFVDRKEAAEIAYEAGQIKRCPPILISEDLY